MIAFAPLGVWLNVQLPVKPLLIFFALFTAAAAVLMLSGWRPKRGDLSPRGRVVLGLTTGSGLGTVAGPIRRGDDTGRSIPRSAWITIHALLPGVLDQTHSHARPARAGIGKSTGVHAA